MNDARQFCCWGILCLVLVFPVYAQDNLVPDCDWRQGQPHKMHWPQLPDLTPQGLDVDVSSQLADDFRCTQSGPITDIHLWGGFQRDAAPDQSGGLVFQLSLYSDIPATADAWSRPGLLLWTRHFQPGQYNVRYVTDGDVGWFDPHSGYYDPQDHWDTYQYNFCIGQDPFYQEAGKIYWLGMRVLNAAGETHWFGWRNAQPERHWNDAGVYLDTTNVWQRLDYPEGHELVGNKMDLSFVITGDPAEQSKYDLGDAPDSSNSSPGMPMTAYPLPPVQAHYPTVYQTGSPPFGPLHHAPKALAYLGHKVTLEIEADLGPDQDPSNSILPRKDAPNRDQADDSVALPLVLPKCQPVTFDYDVTVMQLLLDRMYVNVWFDWNRDGDWDDTVECENGLLVPEWSVQNQMIQLTSMGTITQTTPLFLSWHPLSQDERNPLWMRVTLAERPWGDASRAVPGGAGPEAGYQYGETEDYLLFPRLTFDDAALDWGDAPDRDDLPLYPTLAVHNGASHVAEGPWFGNRADQPDTEADGQAHVSAFGDDLDYTASTGNDDEEGASMPPLVPGAEADATVLVNGGGGVVQVWVDFDSDSVWQASEQVHNSFLPDGMHILSFLVPPTAVSGTSFARFRISRRGGLGPDGPAHDGEVEDHLVTIWQKPPDLKWLQLPDVTQNGIDIRLDSDPGTVPRSLADDFECSCFGRITNVHLWGSWKDDEKGEIERIRIRFRPDDPVGLPGYESENRFSKPGPEVLWERVFSAGQFQENLYHKIPYPGEWWWDPVTGVLKRGADHGLWEVHIPIDPNDAFLQRGTPDHPIVYWLEVQVVTKEGQFGWKTRRWPDHFMDDAVLGVSQPAQYQELRYPKGHPYHEKEQDSVDLAFYLTCQPDQENMPTFRPSSVTQCPPIVTQCPTIVTRCPTQQTICPVVRTVCPAVQTHCPAMMTVCPPKQTQCPPVDTRCPNTRTQCPPVTTLCPTVSTQCPAVATECHVRDTSCPAVETKCPPVRTKCPPVETACYARDTSCPAVETKCPPVETRCPPINTRCPAVDTQCPTASTKCPPAETRCPPINTRCPAVDTQCPTASTKCPPAETRCPPINTRCPAAQTRCPTASTKCPPVETRCPPINTRCPSVDTQCPTASTKCPPVETRCPPINTRCPAVDTQCPTASTKCPPVETRCPPINTKCPPQETECPSVATKCFVRETVCPAVKTQCPAQATVCPPVRTQCPVVVTQCSATRQCGAIGALGDAISSTAVQTTSREAVCPTVNAKCPTLLAASVLYPPNKAPRVAMALW